MNQVVLLVALPWIAYLLVTVRFPPREMIRFLVPFVLALLLVNLPWIIRNFRIWGEFVTRTNLGITLRMSNNDCAEPSLVQELRSGCFANDTSREQRRRSRTLEEYGRARLRSP